MEDADDVGQLSLDGPAGKQRPDSYDDLRAVYINCTLKLSPQRSHTAFLGERSTAIMRAQGVTVTEIRAVDHHIAPGVHPDMTEHGAARDDWPAIQQQVMDADILVLLSPIWLGEKSSVCTRVIERLYGYSGVLNEHGQYAYYGRVAGCLVTGNEDGIKHVAMSVLYGLQHLGFAIPPQADAGWIGEAGPGPSYGDRPGDPGYPGGAAGGAAPVGYDNDFTNRNTTFMTWNLLHLARLLKDNGGVPAHGNQRSAWAAGARFDYPNPEYR
jgi:multimeric flavodoxin WrbA